MDNMVRTWENIEPTEAEFDGLREAELELTDAQLGLIYGGCGGGCPFHEKHEEDADLF